MLFLNKNQIPLKSDILKEIKIKKKKGNKKKIISLLLRLKFNINLIKHITNSIFLDLQTYNDNDDISLITLGKNIENFFINLVNDDFNKIIKINNINIIYSNYSYLFSILQSIIYNNNIDELEDFIYTLCCLGLKFGILYTEDRVFFSAIIGSLLDMFQIYYAFNISLNLLFNTKLKVLYNMHFFLEFPEYNIYLKDTLISKNYIYSMNLYDFSIQRSNFLINSTKNFVNFNIYKSNV